MKVVHFGVFSPHGSGQFSTVIDLIKAERQQGVNAFFVDCGGKDRDAACRVGLSYEGIEAVDPKEAFDADIIVRHSVVPAEIEVLKKPSVMVMHGRPENSFLLEVYEKLPIYSILYDRKQNKHYKAFVTFWKEFKFHWGLFLNESKIFYVPAMVDLSKYCLGGKKFSFGVRSGKPNIVCADVWREDTTPYNVLHAAIKFIKEKAPGGRIHLFGLPHKKKIVDRYIGWLIENNYVGHAWSKIDFLDEVYRAADILVTPHVIATRIVREALACGCPIVAGGGNAYTKYKADPRDLRGFVTQIERCWWEVQLHKSNIKVDCRKVAEENFNLEQAGKKMVEVFDYVLNSVRCKMKLIV